MSFRSRLLIAFVCAALLPLAVLAAGARREFAARLADRDAAIATALATDLRRDLDAEAAALSVRLSALRRTIAADERLRRAIVATEHAATGELADFLQRATQLTGLAFLQIESDSGAVVDVAARASGDGETPALGPAIAASPDGYALIRAPSSQGAILVLARAETLQVAGRALTLLAGTAADERLLRRLVRDPGLSASLITPREIVASRETSPQSQFVAELPLPYIDIAGTGSPEAGEARLTLARSQSELVSLRNDVLRWLLLATVATIALAILLALWLSAQLSRPIAELARTTAVIDLDHLDVTVASDREDEIGMLAGRMAAMTRRLRASAARLRAAERRAAIGDLARQVSHDVKNGLVPIRNVLRHLAEVQEREPTQLPAVFAERRETIESSVAYLDTLARGYARLGTTPQGERVDVNALVCDVARSMAPGDGVAIRTELADSAPVVFGDAAGMRRILENLVTNAIESLPPGGGAVTMTTRAEGMGVQISVADTGSGMSPDQVARAFDDFYTTKPTGTGLGLSVVRRLVSDLHGTVAVDSSPGGGTTVSLTLPRAESPKLAVPRTPAARRP